VPLAQESNATDVEITLMANIGMAYQDLGLYDKAVASLERAVALTERITQPRRIARTLEMMASAQFDSGDRVRAEQTMKRSLEVYEQAQDPTYGRERAAHLRAHAAHDGRDRSFDRSAAARAAGAAGRGRSAQ
jgi:tetratricopeptide (TPR) repeat protein